MFEPRTALSQCKLRLLNYVDLSSASSNRGPNISKMGSNFTTLTPHRYSEIFQGQFFDPRIFRSLCSKNTEFNFETTN